MTICSNLVENSRYDILTLHIYPYVYIGVFRFLSFAVLFLGYYQYRRYVNKQGKNAGFYIILPLYYDFLRLLIAYSLIIGLFNVANPKENKITSPVGLGLQLGGFHFFYEGLWYFMMQYGAGRKSFRDSAVFGFIVAAFTYFTFYFAAMAYINGLEDIFFALMTMYNVVLVLMYLSSVIVPVSLLYRRPAQLVYSVFNCVYYSAWALAICTSHFGNDFGYCVAASNYLLSDGILRPIIMFYTLSMDSQVSLCVLQLFVISKVKLPQSVLARSKRGRQSGSWHMGNRLGYCHNDVSPRLRGSSEVYSLWLN
jgi:hypothetical protein